MNILIILSALVFLSCENPRDKRLVRNTRTEATTSTDTSTTTSGTTTTGTTTTGSTTTTTDSSSTRDTQVNPQDIIPNEIKHCSWAPNGDTGFANTNNAHLGAHTVCQSKTNELQIYFQMKQPTNDHICFIPTHYSGGKSVYVGEPRCLTVSDSKKIYRIDLLKNRDSNRFSNYAINSVMVMKDKAYFFPAPYYQYVLAPDAYIFCSQFLDQYGDSSYCQAFKAKGEYVFTIF